MFSPQGQVGLAVAELPVCGFAAVDPFMQFADPGAPGMAGFAVADGG
jgi:hypothetical protein